MDPFLGKMIKQVGFSEACFLMRYLRLNADGMGDWSINAPLNLRNDEIQYRQTRHSVFHDHASVNSDNHAIFEAKNPNWRHFNRLANLATIEGKERWNNLSLIIDPQPRNTHNSRGSTNQDRGNHGFLWITCTDIMIIVSWLFWSSFQELNDHACGMKWSCFQGFVDHRFGKAMIIVPKHLQKILINNSNLGSQK